nr:hypothetical protein [Tanacetum cinerariifolium]
KNGCEANHAVHESHQFRHLGHFHALGHDRTSGAAHQQTDQDVTNTSARSVGGQSGQFKHQSDCGQHGQPHAQHAEHVAPAGRSRVRQALQCLNKANGRHEIQQGHKVHAHDLASSFAFGAFFLNISSMRRVTRKPPKTLTAASATASVPMVLPSGVTVSAAASIAPTMTMAEIALVTAIRGVCSAGVTFQTTW